MALTIDKRKVLDVLTALKMNVPVSDMSDTSKYTIFQEGSIHAFNDFTGMTIPFDPQMEDCAVESQLLYDFVRGVPDKELIMGLKDGALRIQGANRVGDGIIMAEFPLRDDVYYPRELVETDPNDYQVLPETFALSMVHTSFACDDKSATTSRVAYIGGRAYSHGEVAVCEYTLGEDVEIDDISLLPDAVGFINRNDPRKFYRNQGWLHLMNEDGWIYSARMMADLNFPLAAVQDMLEHSDSPIFRFPAGIKDILQRCQPFSGFSAKIRKVDIRMENGIMTLTAKRNDGSRFLERAKIVDADIFLDISINLATLMEVIELADKYKSDGYRLLGYGTNFRTAISLEAKE